MSSKRSLNQLVNIMDEVAAFLLERLRKRIEVGVTLPRITATDSLSKYRNNLNGWITCVYRKLLACKRSLVEALNSFLGFSIDGFENKLDLIWRLTETALLAQRDLVEAFFASRELPLIIPCEHRWISQNLQSADGR